MDEETKKVFSERRRDHESSPLFQYAALPYMNSQLLVKSEHIDHNLIITWITFEFQNFVPVVDEEKILKIYPLLCLQQFEILGYIVFFVVLLIHQKKNA